MVHLVPLCQKLPLYQPLMVYILMLSIALTQDQMVDQYILKVDTPMPRDSEPLVLMYTNLVYYHAPSIDLSSSFPSWLEYISNPNPSLV